MIQASGLNHDVERLAAAIRDVFLVNRDLSESAVQKLHNELLAYVSDVNARLKECDALLRRGLRQEALQEAEEEPDLLELITQLDFPEWDAWADYVIQFGLPPQPALLLDVAAELNQAYTTAQSLDGLLKLHRLHALARSPLAARLDVLRVIAARDPQNPIWQQDLRAYETARHTQLKSEFKSSLKEGNLRAVADLHRELESSDWSVSPPETMVSEIAAGHQRLIAEDARRHLTMLEPKINAAFSAFDMSALHHARDTWNRFWPLANLPADDALAIHVRPAFAWLDDEISQQTLQADYERYVVALDAALDDHNSQRHDIVRLYGGLERYNEPIPARLQRRYDERLLSLDLTSRRKHRLVLLMSVIAVTLIAATIGLLTFQQLRKSEVAAAEKALKEFVDDNRPQQGAQFYEQLLAEKPHIANAPQVQAAYARVEGQINDEVERQDRLARLLDNANESLATPTWESVTAADKLLQEAHSLAANDGEKVNVLTVDRAVQQASAALQRTVDAQFEQDASALRRAAGSDATLTMGESRRLLQEAQTLENRQRVSNVARQASGIDILVQKLSDRIKQLTLTQNTQELLQNVIQACGRASAYQSAIQRYLKFDVNSPRANAFRQVLDQDISLIAAQSDWNKTADAWNGLSLKSVTDAKTALSAMENLKKGFPEYRFVDDVLALQPYVESIMAREKADGSTLVGELRTLLNDNLFNMKQIPNPRQDDYFYYFGEPMKKATNYEISVLLDSRDWTKTKPQRLSLEQFKTAKERTKSQDTPQKLFADSANGALANKNATYEHTLCHVLHLLFTNEGMDPILKCWLLQTFYDRGSPGSSIVAEEMRGFRSQLESKYTLGDTNFLDRSDPQVTTIRANTADLISRISESPKDLYVERIQPRVKKAIDETVKLPRIEWCGLLLRSIDNSWNVQASEPPAKGELAVLYKSDKGNLQLDVIGVSDGKSLKIEQDLLIYTEGRPVFLIAQE